MKYTFNVPCYASISVVAETEEEALEKVVDYLAVADVCVDISQDGINFSMDYDSSSLIELLSEDSE